MPRPQARPSVQARPKGIPWSNLPPWDHPEHGSWKPRPADPGADASSALYYEKMTALLDRKWRELFPSEPVPESVFCLMRPADGTDPWCAVDMLMVHLPARYYARLSEALKKDNLVDMLFQGVYSYMSPFFEWGLADYWENGYYDR